MFQLWNARSHKNKAFQETMSLLGIECPSLLGYAEGVVKGSTGQMSVDQLGIER